MRKEAISLIKKAIGDSQVGCFRRGHAEIRSEEMEAKTIICLFQKCSQLLWKSFFMSVTFTFPFSWLSLSYKTFSNESGQEKNFLLARSPLWPSSCSVSFSILIMLDDHEWFCFCFFF